MFVALALLAGVALCQADSETITGRIILANPPDQTAAARNHKCPSGYFDALVKLKALTFERGINVVRRNSSPGSLDQIQCSPFPNTVHCELLEGVILCVSGDETQPLLREVEFELDCEVAPSDEACFLEGSCFLRCDSGLSILAIIAIVAAVLIAIGVIAFLVVKFCWRT